MSEIDFVQGNFAKTLEISEKNQIFFAIVVVVQKTEKENENQWHAKEQASIL